MNITKNTTLNELISSLGYLEKAGKRPTARTLRETAGDPIAAVDGCQVYANGYAVYTNGSGTTVLWLKDCLNFTYYFVQPKDGEKESIAGKSVLDENALGDQPWYFGVMLRGDHQVEENMEKRIGRKTSSDGEEDAWKKDDEDDFRQVYRWQDDRFGESPETVFIRRETQREMLDRLTDKQREVFVMYYRDGLTQQEIADALLVSQLAVYYRLEGALKKIRKVF